MKPNNREEVRGSSGSHKKVMRVQWEALIVAGLVVISPFILGGHFLAAFLIALILIASAALIRAMGRDTQNKLEKGESVVSVRRVIWWVFLAILVASVCLLALFVIVKLG